MSVSACAHHDDRDHGHARSESIGGCPISVNVQVVPGPEDHDELARLRSSINPMANLINEKAWGLLGMTAQEFSRAWYAGKYSGSTDPKLMAMDELMRTGTWIAPA